MLVLLDVKNKLPAKNSLKNFKHFPFFSLNIKLGINFKIKPCQRIIKSLN